MKITEQDTLMINEVFKDFESFLKNQDEDHVYFCASAGLCHNIFDFIEDKLENFELYLKINDIQHGLFKSWRYFSGSTTYPVPFRKSETQDNLVRYEVDIRDSHITDEDAAYGAQYNLYDKNTDYGRLRLDLYQHIKDNIFDVISDL